MPTQSEIDAALALGYITPDGQDLLKNGDDAITTNAARSAALITEHRFQNTPLVTGDDANLVLKPGVHPIHSSGVLNLAIPTTGFLLVGGIETAYPVQVQVTWDSVPQILTRRYFPATGAWTAWSAASLMRANAASDEDLDGLDIPGLTTVNTTVTNGPEPFSIGSVFTLRPDVQMYVTREATPRVLVRSETGGAWNPWSLVGDLGDLPSRVTALEQSSGAAGTDPGIHQHLMRETDLRQRIGRISTGGKAAVALVFDHGTEDFETTVLPLLRQHGMPATLALNSGMFDPSYLHAGTNGTVDWATIRGWATGDGIEIANHTATHRGATGPDAMRAEIIGGREALEAALDLTIDSFVQIGVPDGDPDFDGFGEGSSPGAYYTTTAGRMILDGHAIATGSIPHNTQVFGLDGTIPQGVNGRWLDAGTPEAIASIEDRIDWAVANTARTIVRMHPAVLDGTSTISTATFTDFMQYLADRVTAGELVVLPLREWAIATI